MATQTPKDVLKFAKDNKVEAVDLKFCDLLGTWQHFTIPNSELNEELFEEDTGLFDDEVLRLTVARVVLNPALQVEATFNVLNAGRLAQ